MLHRTTEFGKGESIVMSRSRDTGKTVLLDCFETECNKGGALVALATPSAGLGSVEDLLRMTMAWIGSGNGNVNLSTPLHCALREFELAIDLIPKFPSPVLRILIQCRFYAG